MQQDYEFDIGHLKRFSFRELQNATSNFSSKNILGQGGFGVVYKGILPNRTIVAVKKLRDPVFTGEVQFQTEVEMIGLALHRNLLRLYGFCMTPEEKLLVYPYMPNGSVADRLRGLLPIYSLAFQLLCCECIKLHAYADAYHLAVKVRQKGFVISPVLVTVCKTLCLL